MGGKKVKSVHVIQKIINALDDLDERQRIAEQELLDSNNMLLDLDHFLENNALRSYELVRLSKERQNIRRMRREAKIDLGIIEIFKNNIAQLKNAKGKDIMISTVNKKYANMNKEYKNRYFSDADIAQLVKNKRGGRV